MRIYSITVVYLKALSSHHYDRVFVNIKNIDGFLKIIQKVKGESNFLKFFEIRFAIASNESNTKLYKFPKEDLEYLQDQVSFSHSYLSNIALIEIQQNV